MNPENKTEFDFSEWTDEELTKDWNRIDQGPPETKYSSRKADAIDKELEIRGVVCWDKDGNITQRRE